MLLLMLAGISALISLQLRCGTRTRFIPAQPSKIGSIQFKAMIKAGDLCGRFMLAIQLLKLRCGDLWDLVLNPADCYTAHYMARIKTS